jgi:haloacid dehalogenase-like hydrolase
MQAPDPKFLLPALRSRNYRLFFAGIRVVMITGDYPKTAQAIARQVGLLQTGDTITGIELDHMSDTELQRRIQNTNIFARAIPEQKLRIVNALKNKGEVVAIYIPIGGMSLISVSFKLPLVLLPIHVAFLHLIIDPACSMRKLRGISL